VEGLNLIGCWTEAVSNISQMNFGYFVSTKSQQMSLHINIYLVVSYYAQKNVSIKKNQLDTNDFETSLKTVSF
jgi:hypothetical protein